MRYQGQRASVHQDGNLYLARDRIVLTPEGQELKPEHAVLYGDTLVWVRHPEGGMMEPLIEGYGVPGEWQELGPRGAQPQASTAP